MRTHTINTAKTRLSIAAVTIAAGAASALGVGIADFAPRDSVLVAGTNSFDDLIASAERAGLVDLWNEPAIQQFLDEQAADMLDELSNELRDLGFTLDDLSAPQGPAGFALFIDDQAEDPRDAQYHYLVVSDFGDQAQQMHELILAGIDQQEEEGLITFDEEEYNGVTIVVVNQIDPIEDDDADDEMNWSGDDWDSDSGEDFWTTSYYARSGDAVFFSSSLRTIESSIEKAAGEEGDRDVVATDGWAATMNMLGDDHEAFLVSVTNPWYELTRRIQDVQAQEAPAAQNAPIVEILSATGLGEVQGFGISFDLAADGGVMDANIAVAAPQLRGLMGLIPAEDKPFTVPGFVSADASGFSMMQFEFAQLFPAIREILGVMQPSLPPEAQQQTMMGLGMAEGMVGGLISNIGPEVYIVQEIQRPFAADSQKTLLAMTAQNEGPIRQVITQLNQQMAAMMGMGLESREFSGGTIWSLPEQMAGAMGPGMGMAMPGMGDVAIGLGAGHMFIGQTAGIESALRTAADPEAPRLADHDGLAQALQQIDGSGLSFSWSNMEESIAYTQWMIENFDEIQREQLRQMGMTDEQIDQQMEWGGGAMGGPFAMLESLPDLGILADYFGDSVGFMKVTDQGIVGTFKTLRPE